MTSNGTNELVEFESTSMPVCVYGRSRVPRAAPLVLHLHGGTFVGGSPETARTVCTLLADAGAVVVSADYPLAPEHPFPHALQSTFGVLKWLHANRTRWAGKKACLFVAGEEAGGNLAASLALMARDRHEPALAGQILISPMLDPCLGTCSAREAQIGPVGCKVADGWHQYLGSADKAAHPYASPLVSSRLSGLAPALVLTADDDPLRDESLAYAGHLREAGVRVHEHVLAAPTGWPDAFDGPANADPSWAAIVRERFTAFFADTMSGAAVPLRPLHA